MKLDMHIVEAAGMVCQDMGYATAAKGLKRDYELMYQDAWGFSYDRELEFHSLNPKEYDTYYQLSQKEQSKLIETYETQLGRKVSAGECQQEIYLKNFHGIEALHIKHTNETDYWNGILEQLRKGYPVEMWFDQYFMPWTKEVRKKAPLRYQGYMMINGYDEERQMIHCIDIHGTRKQEEMPLSYLKEFMKEHKNYSYTTYDVMDPALEFDKNIFLQRTLQRVNGNTGINMFHEMKRLGEDILQNFDFQKEIDLSLAAKGVLAAPTHVMCAKSFTEVSRMRNLFALTLEYIGDKTKDDTLVDISKRFRLHATKWQMLVSLLGKSFYKKDFSDLNVQISKHIMQIAQEEEQTAGYLEKCLFNNHAEEKTVNKDRREEGNRTQIVFCKLEMNNKGFAESMENTAGADLDGLGNYLLLNETIKKPIIEINDEKFAFYGNEESMDNVCCSGQTVIVPLDTYEGISLLGACDSGAFYGQLECIFEDGSKEEVIFGFGEWRFGKCEFGEELAWCGDRVYWNQVNHEERGYLFTNKINLKAKGKLCAIKLPDCRNMHIFAITLK